MESFQILADSYRSGRTLRISGSDCFAAATFDLVGRRVFLSSENSPAIFVTDLEDRGPGPELLTTLPGNDALGDLHFELAESRLFALQGTQGVLWEVDLRSEAPRARVVSSSLGWPSALAFDSGRRRLFVTDAKEGQIWKTDCDGPCRQPEPFLQPGLLANPTTLETGLDGTLWVGDPESKLLLAIDPNGQIVWSARSLSR